MCLSGDGHLLHMENMYQIRVSKNNALAFFGDFAAFILDIAATFSTQAGLLAATFFLGKTISREILVHI